MGFSSFYCQESARRLKEALLGVSMKDRETVFMPASSTTADPEHTKCFWCGKDAQIVVSGDPFCSAHGATALAQILKHFDTIGRKVGGGRPKW